MAPTLRGQFVTDPEKTDSLLLRNGDRIVGEILELQRGILRFKTDAMATINVKWPRVLTATTSEEFQVYLSDERSFVGSLQATETLGQVTVRARRDTFQVATQSIVELKRARTSFWEQVDGSLDFGFAFAQQNAKTDLTLHSETAYLINRNRLSLTLDGSYSRQDATENITRGLGRFAYARDLESLWFLGFALSAEQNSQLSLDLRGTLAAGPGRYLFANDHMELATLLAIGYARERFTGEDLRTALPLALITDFQWFDWSNLDTDLSVRLAVAPVLNDEGRWRVSFNADLEKEILKHLYFRIGVVEEYDSRPPSVNSNTNDFRITTSIGWKAR